MFTLSKKAIREPPIKTE